MTTRPLPPTPDRDDAQARLSEQEERERADRFLVDIVHAMQQAEEIGGPDGADYVKLMRAVAAEATKRARTFLENSSARVTARAVVRWRGSRPAYVIIDGPCKDATFFADDEPAANEALENDAEVLVRFAPDDQFARCAQWPFAGMP